MGEKSQKTTMAKYNLNKDNMPTGQDQENDGVWILEMPSFGFNGLDIDNHIDTLSKPIENGRKKRIVINHKMIK